MNCTIKEMHCIYGGNDIFGLLYAPECGGTAPVVIMSHGYNSSHAYMSDLAEKLACSGIYAYCYDFCGGSSRSKSSGSTTDMTIPSETEDLLRVLDMITEQPFADRERIYLYGESQGGYISALTAARHPDRAAGLILLYPALCIPDNWRGKAAEMPETVEFMGMTISRKFAENIPDGDIPEQIGGITKPVLILHGEADGLVDISYSERAAECLPNARLIRFAGEGHGFSRAAREKLFSHLLAFVKG